MESVANGLARSRLYSDDFGHVRTIAERIGSERKDKPTGLRGFDFIEISGRGQNCAGALYERRFVRARAARHRCVARLSDIVSAAMRAAKKRSGATGLMVCRFPRPGTNFSSAATRRSRCFAKERSEKRPLRCGHRSSLASVAFQMATTSASYRRFSCQAIAHLSIEAAKWRRCRDRYDWRRRVRSPVTASPHSLTSAVCSSTQNAKHACTLCESACRQGFTVAAFHSSLLNETFSFRFDEYRGALEGRCVCPQQMRAVYNLALSVKPKGKVSGRGPLCD